MKMAQSSHKKVKLHPKVMREKLMKNAYRYKVQFKGREKLQNQINNFEELKCEKSLNINQ